MKFHPIADIFPMMDRGAFEELAEDIRLNGLLEPVVTYEEMILDGRNRYKACKRENVEPRFEAYEGDDPMSYVISLNLKRRHLDESQRAMVAARVENMKEGRPSKTDPIGSVSRVKAAQMLNVGRTTVQRAKAVLEKGTKNLIKAVEDGKIAVSVAAKLADLPAKTQAAAVADPEKAAHVAKSEARERRETELAEWIIALPEKRYGVIYADPPWRFEPYNRDTGMDRAADNHYPTEQLDRIKSVDIASISADDCVLFLWATAPMLPQALEVMVHWGFEYKSHFVWAKDRLGTGYWNRNKHELLLVGVRGDIPAPAPGTQWESVIVAPVGVHSEKPEEAYELIDDYFPKLPKIELYARAKRSGWSSWGAEARLDLQETV